MEEKYQLIDAINKALVSKSVKLTKAERKTLTKHRDTLIKSESKSDYTAIALNIMKLFVVAWDIGQILDE